MLCVAIDPGIVNLGYAVLDLVKDPRTVVVREYGNIDTTEDASKKELWHRIEYAHDTYLREHCEAADVVVVERQPLTSLQLVMGFFLQRYGQYPDGKTQFVSPNSMHRYFGLPRGDYGARKVATERIAADLIKGGLVCRGRRTHDCADAIALALFWWQREEEEEKREEERGPRVDPAEWMDAFRYTP